MSALAPVSFSALTTHEGRIEASQRQGVFVKENACGKALRKGKEGYIRCLLAGGERLTIVLKTQPGTRASLSVLPQSTHLILTTIL